MHWTEPGSDFPMHCGTVPVDFRYWTTHCAAQTGPDCGLFLLALLRAQGAEREVRRLGRFFARYTRMVHSRPCATWTRPDPAPGT